MERSPATDRITAAFFGFAIGDAMGMPAEFLTRDQIKRYYGGPISGFVAAHPGHACDFLPAGSFTDNTQMLLATAESLIECGRADPARQAEALLRWYADSLPHRSPMRANIRACRHLAQGRPWSRSGVFSSGCGAAVRMPPLGLFLQNQPDLLIHAALDNASITHTEPRARAASVAVAYLVARLIQAGGKSLPGDQVLETADRIAALDTDMAAMLRWVTQIVSLPAEEALFEIGTSADALEAVPAATYCFLKHPRNFRSAVLSAVNAGDAADSVGALAGCFTALWNGLDSIPKEWRSAVEESSLIEGIAKSLAAVSSVSPMESSRG